MRSISCAIALLGAVALVMPAGEAHAKPPAGAVDVPKAVPLPADAIKRLKSGDPGQIKSALDDVRMSAKAGAPAVPAIVELLEKGLSPPLTVAAIETLGDTESEGGSDALSWYARHRTSSIRRAAVTALARTRGAAAVKALRTALSDPDPAVRGLSATGLGSMKAKDAVSDLFVALEHKVGEAAASIGQLCAGNECDRLAAKLGSVPFDVVTSGLDQVLFRPAADVSDDLKVRIVGRIRELGTGEANRFLRDVQTKWPKNWSTRVKQSLDQAVLATAASPGSEPTQ
ncbi:MAG TPA: HEAT repeat domain-containing protein [Polyangiaceae bacterium]